MKNLGLYERVAFVLFLGLATTSCGYGGAQPNPGQTSTPSSECAQFVSDAPCGKYTSIGGSDDGKEIPWVTSGEVTAQLSTRGEDTYLTAVMPCGPVDAVVTIKDNTMRLTGQRAYGASGCEEGKGERRDWVRNLLEGGVEVGYNNNTLTWTSGKDSLSFATR